MRGLFLSLFFLAMGWCHESQRKKLTAAQRANKKKYKIIFVNGRQKRELRPLLIDGLTEEEYLRHLCRDKARLPNVSDASPLKSGAVKIANTENLAPPNNLS